MVTKGGKGRLVKFALSLCCYSWDCILRIAFRMAGRIPKATCVILYYHSIPDIHQSAFARQMDVITKLSIPVSIEGTPHLEAGKQYSSITFDDGFENNIKNAFPELRKRGIPATVFLTAAYLGRFAEWWPVSSPEREQKIAPVEKWLQLQTDLIGIGSHSLTHPYLSSLSETEARRELYESRVVLQELFEMKISTFSFPYGDFNAELTNWCRDAGYEHIFTTMPTCAFKNENEYISGRVKVEPTDGSLEFRLKLLGAYRWVPHAIALKHKILSWSMSNRLYVS